MFLINRLALHVNSVSIRKHKRLLDDINSQVDRFYPVLEQQENKKNFDAIELSYSSIMNAMQADARKRVLVNSFYVTILSSGLALFGFGAKALQHILSFELQVLLVFLFLTISIICLIWYVTIRSSLISENIFFRILTNMEQSHHLPDKIMTVYLQAKENLTSITDIGMIDSWLPVIFWFCYLTITIIGLYQL